MNGRKVKVACEGCDGEYMTGAGIYSHKSRCLAYQTLLLKAEKEKAAPTSTNAEDQSFVDDNDLDDDFEDETADKVEALSTVVQQLTAEQEHTNNKIDNLTKLMEGIAANLSAANLSAANLSAANLSATNLAAANEGLRTPTKSPFGSSRSDVGDNFTERTVDSAISHSSHYAGHQYGGRSATKLAGKSIKSIPYGEICIVDGDDDNAAIYAKVFKTDRDAIYYVNDSNVKTYITSNIKKLRAVAPNPQHPDYEEHKRLYGPTHGTPNAK